MERTWCKRCRRSRQIEETSVESYRERGAENVVHVAWLACGHHVEGRSTEHALSDGAPHAGSARELARAGWSSGAPFGTVEDW